MSKIINKREEKILKAKKQNDWSTVLKLLDQEFENSLRQDSRYHLTSLNKIVSYDGKYTELIDIIPNSIPNPLDNLIERERKSILYNVLNNLNPCEYKLFIDRVEENKSFRQLATELGVSDKTAKARFEKIRFKLQEELNDWRF
ncbi:sigma-70 family RNA polymerase sigma factor [Streptococcus sp. SO4]|uniref:sigma-70 family RNA polymerase sigma factor n=1 Tax=Streptococcus sp. SO4 TaxID=3018249 RepID=UPI00263D43A7|nr:sigma-70 family RNA polymerase sigma factor [Streptococcus sp. SO4]MDN5025148.1 sigma-70 family RNA polymerase sigma factor [Streptococcus sp. SO4]